MSVLTDLRIEAGLSMRELAQEARISRVTLQKAEQGEPIQGQIAGKICRVLSEKLNRHITYKEAEINIV